MKRTAVILAAAGATLLGAGRAQATDIPGGVIIGVFGSVVTSGNAINDPAIGENSYLDNAGSAVYSISNSTDTTLSGVPAVQTTGSNLQWGSYPPGYGVDPSDSFSEIEFFGAQAPADIHEPFQIGTITFLNGTSELPSLIFSASLSFYVNTVSPSTYLGTDTVDINTTSNYDDSLAQDADWINICGNDSNICTSRLEAFEDSEGGTGVTAYFYGDITGDPKLTLDSISLAPGQDPATSGFIGSGPPLSAPEPSSWALVLFGFGLCIAARFGAARPRARTRSL